VRPYGGNAEQRHFLEPMLDRLAAENPQEKIPHLYRTPHACQPRPLTSDFLTVVTLLVLSRETRICVIIPDICELSGRTREIGMDCSIREYHSSNARRVLREI